MRRAIAKLLVGLVLTLATVGAIFVIGMRAKSPAVVDSVRRLGRATRPMAMKTAGTPTTGTAVVRHTGRRSGQVYETPVGAVPTDDGFVIALPYGTNTDWLKNVLSSGSATVILRGREYQVDEPEVIPLTAATPYFTRADQQAHRLFGVEKSLRVRRTDAQRVV